MWTRFRYAWYAFWNPREVEAWDKLAKVLASPVRPAVEYALSKVANDPSFHPTKDHARKRAEALEWVGHSLRDGWHGYTGACSAWETSFLLEWEIGCRKGML